MHARFDQVTDEATILRRCMNDLIRLFAPPAMWSDAPPEQITRTLVDALAGMLPLDLVYVRLNPTEDNDAVEMVKSGSQTTLTSAREAGAALGRALGEHQNTWPSRLRCRLAGAPLSIVTMRLGAPGDIGVLVAASERPTFADDTELLLMNVAANQAVIALQGARLLGEPTRSARILHQRVAQRTSELAEVNDALNDQVAELRRTEGALRDSERHLRSALDGLPGFVATLAPSGEVEAVNRQIVYYTGRHLDDLKHWGTNGTVHADDIPRVAETFTKSIATGASYDIEQRLRRFDGAYRWFSNRGIPARDASGHIVRWYVLLTDVDERRQAEEALRESELSLRSVIDGIPGFVAILTADGGIKAVNRQIAEYCGLSINELHDWGSNGMIHPEDLPRATAMLTKAIAFGEPYRLELRLRRFDDVYRWFDNRVVPVRGDGGRISLWYVLLTDIDERRQAEEALRASETRLAAAERELKLTIDTIPALAWSARPDGSAEFFNQHYQDYVGLSLEQLQGWAWMVAVHPDDLRGLRSAWATMMASGRAGEAEARLRRFDGEYRWLLFRANPLRDESGHIVKWYGIYTDFEDRKRAESQLGKEKQLLEMIASGRSLRDVLAALCKFVEGAAPACHCGVYPIDWAGPIFQYGVAPSLPASYTDPIEGLPVRCDVAPCGIAAHQNIQVIATDIDTDPRWQTSPYRTHVLEHGLRSVWSTPICSREGRVLGTFCIYQRKPASPSADHQDLIAHATHIASIAIERSRVDTALIRSQALLAEGQRLSLTGTFAWNVDKEEITFSAELRRIFELDADMSVTLEQIAARVHPEDVGLLSEKIRTAQAGGDRDLEYEIRLLMPAGRTKYVHAIAHRVPHGDSEVEFLGAVMDITDRRLSEQALDRVRSELAHVTRTMSLGVLTASIAHEVNQPLSGIITNANTCLRMLAATPPNVAGALETARRTIRDGNRASEVVARLRALFRKKEVIMEAVDLNEATREVIALSGQDLHRRRISLQTELDGELPPVSGDRVQLQQVILNLLLNACDAMGAVDDRPKQIVIRTARGQNGAARLTVRDSGVGVVPDSLNKLFDAFYTTKADGMGIGLSVSRSIIESHHGRLWCEPNEGPGATFAFSIPVTPSAR
jgi:PAS domain S-box-containing protein